MSAVMTAQKKTVDNYDGKIAAPTAILQSAAVQPRALGQATLVSGPTACSGGNCYQLNIDCSELQAPVNLSLRVAEPVAQVAPRGTIIFMSGGGGTDPWDNSTDARRIISDLRANGFRTVILQWTGNGWLAAKQGWHSGQGRLACRPATAARWIHDNLFTPSAATAFCATGQSGGSSQVAYMITQYGLSNILSAVVPTGGPPMGRVDLGCLKYDPANQTAWYNENASSGTIDEGFGYTAGSGPCTTGNYGFRKRFQEASVAFGDWQYNYPKTMVWMLLGAQDTTPSVGQSQFYYQRLLDAGTPFLHFDIVPNTAHGVQNSPTGSNMIRDIMLNECRLR